VACGACEHRLQSLRVPARLFPGLQAAAAAGGGTGRWSLLTKQEDEAYTTNLRGWRAQAATEAGAEWLGELAQAELDELHELVEDRVDASPPPLPLADLSKVEQWASLKAGKHQETCELQEWRAKAKERRPAVLAKLGAQIAAAVGLLQSFFKQFVSIAANDPDMTSLHFEEYESWPLTMPAGEADSLRGTTENSEHVSALLACFADCLAGNTFLRGFDMSMCLPYHQYAWAAASHAQFRRLVTQCNTAG
jgi:hypothetical protein